MAKEKTKEMKENESSSNNSEKFVSRGRVFEGFITKKFPRRVVVEFQRTVFVRKYDRSYRKKTRLHARIPKDMEGTLEVGDYIKVRETRPLSKIINFVVIEKIRSKDNKEAKK